MPPSSAAAPIAPTLDNPFDSDLARAASSYVGHCNKRLVTAAENDEAPVPLLHLIHAAFRSVVLDPRFSCVGAKSAIAQGGYRIGYYGEMGSEASTAGLAYDLYHFVQELPTLQGEFSTFVATFANPIASSEAQFEQHLWQQLQQLNALDAPLHRWDPQVSADPDDSHFSFSFAEHGFFIVGLHPVASRLARRFAWPTLVFNVHAQFEALRESGRFGRMQTVIRQREQLLQGSINTNLTNYGTRSDARQYSGRAVGEHWKCPFVARNANV